MSNVCSNCGDNTAMYCAQCHASKMIKAQWICVKDQLPADGEIVLTHSWDNRKRLVTRDSTWAGGWKQPNCKGWESVSTRDNYITHFLRVYVPPVPPLDSPTD
jgi:hypothetical protein